MAIVEVNTLIYAISPENALEDIINLAESMDLRARSWRIGSKARFWIVALAEVAHRISVQNALLTAAGYNQTSWGNALTKFSKSRFEDERIRAIKTQGGLLLSDVGGNGPYTIGVGEYVFSYDQDPNVTFRNITGGTLVQDGTLEITIEAETGGEGANVPTDSITAMNPTIAGVSANNPANPTDWITRYGVNVESDASLRLRNEGKWATLGGNPPSAAYEFWARTATDIADDAVGITRVFVDDTNPRGPMTLDVYVADDSGTATVQQVSDIQDYVDARKSVTADPLVIAATERVIPIVGTFHVRAGRGTKAAADALAAVTLYINDLPIGGQKIGSSDGRLLYSELIAAVMGVQYVIRVSISSPSDDVAILPGEVAVLGTYSMTVIEV